MFVLMSGDNGGPTSATTPMPDPVFLYGIANCTTVKKARQWLAAHGIPARFHDFKTAGVPAALDDWVATLGWEPLLNRRGTTWRRLPEDERGRVHDAPSAIALMRAHPSAIKRPLLVTHGQLIVSFEEETYNSIFRHSIFRHSLFRENS